MSAVSDPVPIASRMVSTGSASNLSGTPTAIEPATPILNGQHMAVLESIPKHKGESEFRTLFDLPNATLLDGTCLQIVKHSFISSILLCTHPDEANLGCNPSPTHGGVFSDLIVSSADTELKYMTISDLIDFSILISLAFSAALQLKSLLLHGRLYISSSAICFYSGVFGRKTSVREEKGRISTCLSEIES